MKETSVKAALAASTPTINVEGSTIAASAYTLSEDGRTLTLTLGTSLTQTAVDTKVEVKGLVDKQDVKVEDYSKVVSLSDTVRPTIADPSFTNNTTLKFDVSEPINANNAAIKSALSVTDVNGSPVDTTTFAVNYVEADGSFTINNISLKPGKYTFKFTGLKDYAANLINPNPVEKIITVSGDEVAPTIQSITNVGLDAANNGYLRVNFSEPVDLDLNDTVATTLNGAASAVNGTVVEVSADKKSVVLKYATQSQNYQTVSFAKGAVKDLAGNDNVKFDGSVTFKANKPVVSEYSYSLSKDEETVTFDREIKIPSSGSSPITLTGTKLYDNVESTVSATATVVDGKLVIDTASLSAGEYTFTFAAGTVEDVAGQGNAAGTLKFTLDKAAAAVQTKVTGFVDASGNSIPSTTTPVVNGVVYVKYDNKVDVSAVDVTNYTVEGQQVFSKAVFTDINKNIVKLTLKSDVIAKDSDYSVEIKNIKDAQGKAVKAFTGVFKFDDNTAPIFTALEYVSNTNGTTGAKLTATFSEDLATSTASNAVAPVDADFVVTVNGIETTATVTTGTADNKLTIELDAAKSLQANDVVVVKVKDTAAFTDASALNNAIVGGQSKTITIK